MSSTGTITSSSMRFALAGCTTVTWRAPPRNVATSSGGRTVADSPIRCARPPSSPVPAPRSASSRSSDSARCAPRLLPATACTSSTITVSTPRSISLAWEVSSRNSDSGVVIRMSGGRLASLRRSSAAVSPVRIATPMSGSGSPSRCDACLIPVSGERRFRSMSTASAFSGETYSTRQRRFLSAGGGVAASLSIAHRNAASVFPDPVGATTRVSFFPARPSHPIARHACACACVGTAKAPSNHARVAGENPSRASALLTGGCPAIPLYCLHPPTFLSIGDESGARERSVGRRSETHWGGPMTSKPFTTCLWFDNQGEEAAHYYMGIFKDSRLGRVQRYTSAGPGAEGTVATVEFELNGQKFLALNGGPLYQFNAAVSIVVECADQAEVDYYWDRLTDGGQEVACGWLVDKYGLSWQVVPTRFLNMVTGGDQEKAARATAAMLTMKKFDIAALERAYAGTA